MTSTAIVFLTDEQAVLVFGGYGAYVLAKAFFAAILWGKLRKRFRFASAIALVALPPIVDGLLYLLRTSKSSRIQSF